MVEDYSLLDERTKKLLLQARKNILLFADTSLCPCGKAELKKSKKCGFSLQRCRATLEKMSESGLSSFDIFLYRVNDYKLLDKKECLKKWTDALGVSSKRQKRGFDSNNIRSLKSQIDPEYLNIAYLPQSLGEERLKKLLLISRSIADLRGHEKIEKEDLGLALDYGFYPLKELVSLF